MDSGVESVGIGECLMGEMMGFEIAPNRLDIIEFGRVFRQPLDREPMGAGRKRGSVALLTWIGPLSSTMTTGLMHSLGFGP